MWPQNPTKMSSIAKTNRDGVTQKCPYFCPAHSDPCCLLPEPGLFPGSTIMAASCSSQTWGLSSPTYPPSLSPSDPERQNFSLSTATTIFSHHPFFPCLLYSSRPPNPSLHLFSQSNHFTVKAGHASSLLKILQWLPTTLRTQDKVFFKILFIYLFFIFGCIGSSLLRAGFLLDVASGASLRCIAWASHCSGFSCCRARALGTWASVVVAQGLQ